MNHLLTRRFNKTLCIIPFCRKLSAEFSPRQAGVELEDGVRILGTSSKKRSLLWYENQMIKLGDGRNLSKALDLVERRMPNDKITPSSFILHKLIYMCAQSGYIEKALSIFHWMKRNGHAPKAKTYTALFHACSACNNKSLALEKSHAIRSSFDKDKATGSLNDASFQVYSAMIKAFGSCGDVQTAFSIMDEIHELYPSPNISCFNALLHTCIEQGKNTGLELALDVWKKMLDMAVKPELKTIELLLRLTRDINFSSRKIDHISSTNNTLPVPTERDSSVLSVFGGVEGILKICEQVKDKPSVKTLTLLIQQCPAQDELAIFSYAKELNIKVDTAFFNCLISKLNRQKRHDEAKQVAFELMPQYSVIPNLHTFGAVAMGCFELPEAKELLSQLENKKMLPSVELFNILLFNSKMNFALKSYILTEMSKLRIEPNKKTISLCESSILSAKKIIAKKETQVQITKGIRSNQLGKRLEKFLNFYSVWLKKTPIDQTESDPSVYFAQKQREDKCENEAIGSEDNLDSITFIEGKN